MVSFEVPETQQEIVRAAGDLAHKVLGPAEVELDKLADPDDVYGDERFRAALGAAYAMGLHKMGMPEQVGGLGLGRLTTTMVWEEIARHAPGFAATLVAASVAPQLIAFLAPHKEELVARYVTPFCEDTTGSVVSAWGSSEPDVGSDGSNYYDTGVHHHTTAVLEGGRWVLSGTKSDFVSNGGLAQVYVVFACVDPTQGIRGSGAFVVPGDAAGLARGKALQKVGLRTLNQAALHFDGVEVPEDHMIFPPGDDYPTLHNAIVTVGNIGVGAIAVGVMRGAYEEALAYAKTRVQWAKPIREHGIVAEKLFEAFQVIEAARALVWKASWLSESAFPGDLKTSLAAKVFATNAAVSQVAEMCEILGGYGISCEYPIEKLSRDAALLKIMDGANHTLTMKAAAEL